MAGRKDRTKTAEGMLFVKRKSAKRAHAWLAMKRYW